MMGGGDDRETNNEGEDDQAENEPMAHGVNESAESALEEGPHEIEVPASDFYEDPNEEPDFMTIEVRCCETNRKTQHKKKERMFYFYINVLGLYANLGCSPPTIYDQTLGPKSSCVE